MKNQIINLLLKFNEINYDRLYEFLTFNKKVSQFRGMANQIDCIFTFKHKNSAENIYKKLCENKFSGWNIEPELLFNVLNGDLLS